MNLKKGTTVYFTQAGWRDYQTTVAFVANPKDRRVLPEVDYDTPLVIAAVSSDGYRVNTQSGKFVDFYTEEQVTTSVPVHPQGAFDV